MLEASLSNCGYRPNLNSSFSPRRGWPSRRQELSDPMSNPYATPEARGTKSALRKPRGRIFKHICIFSIFYVVVNFDRFFGSKEHVAEVAEVSIAASVITLLLLYGAGYLVFSRARSPR